MQGRMIFRKYKRLIEVSKSISKIIPNPLFRFINQIFYSSESRFAIFIRYLYLHKIAKICGDNVFIGKNVVMKNIEQLEIGSNVSVHAFCYLDSSGGICIGDNVSIANHTSLISFNHSWDDPTKPIKYNPVLKEPIVINNDVWVGNGCRILAGVKVGSRSIIAAGAVVTKSVDEFSVVGGVPARVIKEIRY